MTKSAEFLVRPEYWIREYIFNELKQYDSQITGVSTEQTINPIIPVGSSYNNVFQNLYEAIQNETNTNPTIILYDKLMRFRTSPFYRIKKEQLILEVLHPDFDIVDNVTKIIEQSLDREDVAAQEINKLARDIETQDLFHNVFFHKVRVFKVDESRDLVELNSVNLQFARTRIVVEYDYHAIEPSDYAPDTPNNYT